MGKGVGQVTAGLTKVAEKAAITAVVAGGSAVKIAADFQDAFAAVEKTVEGTPAQLDAIDQALRRLSTNIPVTFQGLASIASEAGALGVHTKDIVAFSEAVARTSAATVGLSEFDASEAFGKLSTIFNLSGDLVAGTTGKMVSDYERLGSTLTALGNAGASSEADIIAVTKRFAAAGQQAGLSAAQVLGWSSALASLGPEAEAAGGALQRIFNRTTQNIGLMGVGGVIGKNATKKVDAFASVTGMTRDEFVALYTKDSSAAIQRFIQGLGGLDKFGQARALRQAGVINQRDILALESFTSRYGVLTTQLDIANKAWAEGTALQEVSDKRFDTLKNKAIEFKNQVLVGAAAVGDGMLPAIGRLVAKAKEFVGLHMGDLTTLGTNIGAAIDAINWTEVKDGAETFVGFLKTGYDIISQIPSKLLIISAGFLGINKLSGGLLGAGLGNIVAGLGKGVANVALSALSSVPGIGGAIGAATATRVFVVNFPPGFGGVPGLAAGAGAAEGGGMALLGMGGLALGAVAAAEILVAEQLGKWFRAQPWWDTQIGPVHIGGASQSQTAFNNRPATGLVGGFHDPQLNSSILDQTAELREANRINAATRLNTANTVKALGGVGGAAQTKGPPVKLNKYGAIGSASDPFGFVHIKTFAYNNLGKNDPLGLKGELQWHIGEVDTAITKAVAKGDTETANKLRETKSALSFLLGEVKDGTYVAGDKAYAGALVAASAANATTAAVYALPALLAGTINLRNPGIYTGIPYLPGGSPPKPPSGGTSGGTVTVPHGARLAAGGIVKRRPGGTEIVAGEGRYDEAIVPLDGHGQTIRIYPQPVRLSIDGREIARADVMADAFTR